MTSARALVAAAALATVVAAAGVVTACGGSSAVASGRTQSVRIDLAARRQVIQGFGTSVRVWSDPHLGKSGNTSVPAAAQAQILTELYGRLGLTRSRQVLDPGIQATKGGPFDFSGKLGEAQVAYVKQARRYGLRTTFPGPVYLEDWMQADDPGSYVDYAMAILRYWRDHGFEPPLYAPLNEPEVSHDFPPSWMHDVVLQLGRRLRAEGFRTKLVIPDDENPVEAYRRAVAVLDDPKARQYVGAVAFHIYHGDEGDWPPLRQLASKYGLPLWMTEYWDRPWGTWPDVLGWATTVHALLTVGQVNAVDYIWGFFGDWVTDAGALIAIHFDDGVYRSHQPTPLYWVTGQWSRFVRPGYRRISATGGRAALVSAFLGPRRLVVVAVNAGRSAQPVSFAVRGGRVGASATAVRSSATERWRTLSPVRVRGGRLTATLAPQSVTTFLLPAEKLGPT